MNKLFIFLVITALYACNNNFTPKPYAYFRVDLPEPAYRLLDTLDLPYSFEISNLATLTLFSEPDKKNWINITYPYLQANIFCSYMPVKNNMQELAEDSRRYVYKHISKAEEIREQPYENPYSEVYGILYDLKGNTASSIQFAHTDSMRHFFRAALYFDNPPNKDSIAPMNDYIRRDIIHLIETFKWKK